jgi:capsular exopolysaccharide synthesis family protein
MFQIQKLLKVLRKLWWVPVLSLTLLLAAATGYILKCAPTFRSQASLWEPERFRLQEGAQFSEDPQNFLGNQTELIKSGKLQQLTMASLQAERANGIPRDQDGKPLKVKLAVKAAPKSSMLVVEASGADADYVQAYLDTLLNQYIKFNKDIRKLVSGDTLASISEQVLRLERDLKTDQDALTIFEQSNNLAILQEEGTVAGGYLEKLQTQLSDYQLESQLLEATALEHGLNEEGNNNFTGSLFDSLREQNAGPSAVATGVQSAYQQVELLKLEREKLSKYLRPKHPKIVKLNEEIGQAQKVLEIYGTQNRDQLASARQALKMRSASVQASIKEWQAKVVEANARIAEADHLKLNVARTQSLYDRLVALLNNVDISRNIDQDTLAILEPASSAERTHIYELMALALALVGGLTVGVGVVCLIALRDDRFTSVSEVNAALGNSVVGLLPEMTPPAKDGMSLLEINDPHSMYAESYRSLRSALLYLPTGGGRPKVVLITSAVPNEGKSTIAANLARTLASGGSRVLLVDADLRKGHLHEMLGLHDAPGLVELLQHPADLESFIQVNSLKNFAFLSRGTALGHTSDLFLGTVFDQLLAQMRQKFDYVLIDSSPVFAADDASTLAPKVDGTLFVVRNNFSSARLVREGLELLQRRQSNILGLVLNRTDATARSYNYYKFEGYHGAVHEPRNGVAKS